jgi:hypothetical protein
MSPRTPADWSLPAASFSAPVLGSDQSACPVFENYILISRSSCPTYGVHFRLSLDHLYLHPDFQSRGIGGFVLKHLFAEADQNATPIKVGALKESASNRFYQRYGFEKTGESDWDIYYVRPPSKEKTKAYQDRPKTSCRKGLLPNRDR